MESSKPYRIAVICAAAVALPGACLDLDVENTNAADRRAALANPSDVQLLVTGAYRQWWTVAHGFVPAGALSTAADAHSSASDRSGQFEAGREPRRPMDNSPVAVGTVTNSVNIQPWAFSYVGLASVRDGLLAIEGGLRIIVEGEDHTERVVAFGKFVQALTLANLAVLYDRAFIVDETVDDVGALEVQTYTEMWAAAEQKFTEVIEMASGADFTIPSQWVGHNGDWSGDYMAEVARAYRTRYRTQVPRSPAERDALDWEAIRRDAMAGLSRDFAGRWVRGQWPAYHIAKLTFACCGVRMDYRTIGPADASGQWETWINAPLDERAPFLIDTDDRRITGESPTTDGTYIGYLGNSPFPPDRGLYHHSHYVYAGWLDLYQRDSEHPDLTNKELEFIVAEADYRLGNGAAVMEFVNGHRASAGLPPFTSADGPAPGGDRCVPQMPDGSCGSLWEAYKYEKRIELFHYGFGTEYFNDRGWGDLVAGTWEQFPIPGRELELLMMELYTFGGQAGADFGDYFNDVSPRALKSKLRGIEMWVEVNRPRQDRPDVRPWQ